MTVPRPVLRYYGGKWRIAPWIIGHFPEHRVYLEAFGGGGSVLLRKPRSPIGEIYNDLDGEVVNFFRVLRAPDLAAELARLVVLTPYARAEYDAVWEEGGGKDPVERARRFLVRCTMGFGSNSGTRSLKPGFRSKRAGWSLPAQDWANYPPTILAAVERLRGVVIEQMPALDLVARYDAGDVLIYADPPYPKSVRTDRRNSYRCEMTDADHEALATALHAARGAVVVSGYRCALYDRLYADWTRVSRPAVADRAAAREECLWLSPRALERKSLLEVK